MDVIIPSGGAWSAQPLPRLAAVVLSSLKDVGGSEFPANGDALPTCASPEVGEDDCLEEKHDS